MTRRLATGLLAVVLVFGAAACGADDNGGALDTGPTTSAPAVDIALVVDVTATSTGDRSGSVTCRGTVASGTGTFLDPTAASTACKALLGDAALTERLVKGPVKDQPCTMQDGGPAAAHVTGTVRGTPVDTTFSMHGGCEISDFQAFVALLGNP